MSTKKNHIITCALLSAFVSVLSLHSFSAETHSPATPAPRKTDMTAESEPKIKLRSVTPEQRKAAAVRAAIDRAKAAKKAKIKPSAAATPVSSKYTTPAVKADQAQARPATPAQTPVLSAQEQASAQSEAETAPLKTGIAAKPDEKDKIAPADETQNIQNDQTGQSSVNNLNEGSRPAPQGISFNTSALKKASVSAPAVAAVPASAKESLPGPSNTNSPVETPVVSVPAVNSNINVTSESAPPVSEQPASQENTSFKPDKPISRLRNITAEQRKAAAERAAARRSASTQ